MLTEVLKSETKTAHTDLEGRMIPSIKAIQTQGDYRRLLEMMYGFYQPLEERIGAYITEQTMPGYQERRKASLLVEDIAVLNNNTLSTPEKLCADLPGINNYAQALGAMYVLEGSTLGGKIIAGMVQKRVEEVDNALLFFNGYGEKAMDMWMAFKEQVNKTMPDNEQKEVVQAANDTFTSFKRWIELYEQP
ncbi:heme oxygenase [Filimonas zeae]|uniref:Heme oxygenase n=1 Tax=Filimonas zeae TaxID=1737353 RepID=A0A917J581_9BACT|nr:biliverdin-producing heme oxygenase [Filimonas zeae]MDR6340775.1 heme oxygenase [Filimonas zeae]GGH78501.1 heme oxygenase [Filimonas zeae]